MVNQKGAFYDIGPPMTYAQMKIPKEQADQTECKNGFTLILITVAEFLLFVNRRRYY